MYRQRHCTCTCMYDGRQNAMYICMYVWWQAVAFRVQGLGRQIRLGFSSGFRVQGLGRQKALPFTRTWEAGTRREPQDEIVQMANSHTLTNRELVFAFSTNGKFPFTNDKSLHISKTTNSHTFQKQENGLPFQRTWITATKRASLISCSSASLVCEFLFFLGGNTFLWTWVYITFMYSDIHSDVRSDKHSHMYYVCW